MTLDTFFEKFDIFADAPDAVAKMRELVLQLAVQGKLVDQLPSDEPAAKLLERIQKSKERLINERSIRRQETDPIDNDSAPFPIPQSWVWTRLGEIGDWGSGSTPARGSHELYGGGITWLKSGELNDNQALVGSSETVTELALKTGSFRRNQPGDVLFAMYGATIGKVAILAEPAVTNQAVCGCTPFESISNRYLFNYLLSQRAAFHEASEGGAQPNLSKVKIVAFPFPLPPLAEQKRIVAKVDELMALCDRLEAQQQERETRHAALARASLARFADAPTPANLNLLFHSSFIIPPSSLRQSILTLAVQGKLVPQDPNDEPAEEVLARIAATKLRLQKSGEIAKEKPFEPLQSDNLPFEAPESWRWAKLAELTELITKGSSPKWQGIAYVSESEGILFITSENVGNYVLRKLDDLKYVSKGFNEIEPRSILKRGDILMNLVGASIGRTAVYDLHDGANINQAVALIRLVRETDGVCPRFLLHYLNSPTAIDYMLSSRVVNAQPNISLTDAREFAVPIPPLAEQRRIVAKVEQRMALVDALETQLAASRATAANLLSALVAELTGTDSRLPTNS